VTSPGRCGSSKGNRERLVPLPKDFGQVFGFWLSDRRKDDFVFAKEPGGKVPGPTPPEGYLRRLLDRAGLDKKVTPHKLRHTYATRLLEVGTELVDIQALRPTGGRGLSGKDDFVFAKEPGGGGGEALTALPPLAATHSAYNG
jgi:site-specific recombinase XerC